MNNTLKHIKHTGFIAPKDYFKSFDKALLQQIDDKNPLTQTNPHGFEVPENYFTQVDGKVLKAIAHSPKVLTLPVLKKAVYATAIAASMVLALVIFTQKSQVAFGDLETSALETYIEQNFDLQDVAPLIEGNMTTTGFYEVTFSEEPLDDYILNHTSIEDLIPE
ncbi:hypothetical protein IA57_01030 [Mangrovimonas yunxiaonensis]|uniref:Uncharacterized protein n=1 Tax=Mangrovimonas yunxiaonensis TaxID=1197477 RepID=A0A084TNG6_9FLAO|nr:hypothetical protein [Mangrovimonas yunxiaonensis]KFB02252.1 hypothetical protein IA57_01030 [Mangrovimonas yunxiaonensis]GGH39222.1 hypothetical protein GCM10011364_08490 [Mangrovimonas yunxiaonensis]